MNIRNFEYDATKKAFKEKLILTATLMGIIGFTLTGCVAKPTTFKELDRNKVQTETTTYDERKEYYKEIDKMFRNLSQEDKEEYMIDVNVIFVGAPEDDKIMFLRNDGVYKGDLKTTESKTKLTPGVYKVISLNAEEGEGLLGEIELLEPGEDVTIKVDYNSKTATVSNHKAK